MYLIPSAPPPARNRLRPLPGLFAATALLVALAPASAQQGVGAPLQGPPDTGRPAAAYGADDPDIGRDPGDGVSADGAAADGEYAADPADRIRVQPELPQDTPADVVELAKAGAPVTSLTDALRLAYWTSPPLLAQRATLRSADYRMPQARAGFGPKLNYNITGGWVRDGFDVTGRPAIARRGFSPSASLILTQPLFTWGRNTSQVRSAAAQIDFQRQVLRSTEQQALLDAITAYIGVLRDRASVVIAKDNLTALERQLFDNRARLAVNEVTVTDVQQVQTRAALGRAQVYSAQRDAASSEASFLRMVGAPAGQLVPPNPLQLPVRDLEAFYAFAETHSPIVLAAQAREKVSRASVAAAKADLMPRVDFQGTALTGSQSDYNSSLDSFDRRQVRGQIVISGPLFETGLRQARVGEAVAANDADWRLLDSALRESRATLASSWNDWQAQQAAISSYRDAEASARKAYEGAVLQQRAGLITTLDVLDLVRELLVARSNSNTAIANAYIAKARVLAAAGALEQVWLMPDEQRYSAERHYNKVRHRGDIPLIGPLLNGVDSIVATEGTRARAVRDPAGARTAQPIVIQPAETLANPTPYSPAPADGPASNPANAAPRQ